MEDLALTMGRLAVIAARPSAGYPRRGGAGSGPILGQPRSRHEHWKLFRMRPALVEAITELQLATNQAVKFTFDQGKRHGADLLRSLASGDRTVDDFNERIAR